jgi:hypothetical protein
MVTNSTKTKLAELIGAPWPTLTMSELGIDITQLPTILFPVVHETERYTIYAVSFNSKKLDFNSASKKACYQLNKIQGYLVVPKSKGPFRGLIGRHQSKWQYQYGAAEVVGLAGDGEDPLQNLAPFAVDNNCVLLCTDSAGYGESALCEGRNPIELAQIEATYDRLLRCYGKSYIWDVVNDINANVTFLDYLAQHNIVYGSSYAGIGHSMGGQQVLVAAPFVPKLTLSLVNDGFTTIRYIGQRFPEMLHGPSIMLPDICAVGDNEIILAANAEAHVKVFLALGEEDKANPYIVAQAAINELREHDIQLLIHPGGHQLTHEALNWFGRAIRNHRFRSTNEIH